MEVSHDGPFFTDSPISVFSMKKMHLRLCMEAFNVEATLQVLFPDFLGTLHKKQPEFVKEHFMGLTLKKGGITSTL